MPTAREVKKRIRSVKNIGQITRALQAVSASRVRKAQARVLASRAFAERAWEILLNVQNSAARGTPLHPLLTPRENPKNAIVILITSDRGLAGAFNTNIIRVARRFSERIPEHVRYVTIGRKGRDSLIRLRANVIAEFSNPSDSSVATVSPIARLAIDEFLSGTVDEVFVAYTDFINTLTQRPRVLRLLPLTPYQTQDHVVAEFIKDVPHLTGGASDYEYEPSAEAILDEIVPRFTILQLYQAVLESQASEHSARMVAMRNASDNSDALAEDLTLVYNKARQAGITNEILDIVGGAEALTASIDKIAEDILQMRRMEIVDRPHSTNGGSARPKKQDDLKRIEGIEEKFELALKSAGIDTFEKLAKASEEELLRAVYDAGYKFPPSVHTWTEQAQYAARGDWDGLRKLDVSLIAGRRDKLVEIEGIGPKIASALNAAGINTFAQLASATEEQLRAALSDAGMRYAPSLPTWARQAEFAARGDWDGLKELQASLVAGRNA